MHEYISFVEIHAFLKLRGCLLFNEGRRGRLRSLNEGTGGRLFSFKEGRGRFFFFKEGRGRLFSFKEGRWKIVFLIS